MKKSFVVFLTGLIAMSCLAAPAQARKDPKIYDHARAIPTRSGENVRITLYTKRIRGLRVRVDDSRKMRAQRFGTGCGELRCQRWKVYAVRLEDECYDLGIESIARPGEPALVAAMTVCEPFRNGSI